MLRAALTDACHEQLITVNPAKLVKLPSGKAAEGADLDTGAGRLLAGHRQEARPGDGVDRAADTSVPAPRRQAPAVCAVHAHRLPRAAPRRGRGLRWQDLDLDSATATIRWQLVQVGWDVVPGVPKTDAGERTIALAKPVLAALREWEVAQAREKQERGGAWTDSKLVFTLPDGSALHPAQVTGWFMDLAREAALPPIRLHDLRHGTATHMLTSGVEMKVVSEILGHSNVAITADLYTAVVDELKKNAADAITGVFGARGEDDWPDAPVPAAI